MSIFYFLLYLPYLIFVLNYYKLQQKFNFELGPKSNYRVKYTLEIEGGKPVYGLCEHYVKKDKDLNECLNEFSLAMSDNNQHVAVGIKNKFRTFYHYIIEGKSFSSGSFYFDKSNIDTKDLSLDKIDWRVFPESKDLFNTILINDNRYALRNESAITYKSLLVLLNFYGVKKTSSSPAIISFFAL